MNKILTIIALGFVLLFNSCAPDAEPQPSGIVLETTEGENYILPLINETDITKLLSHLEEMSTNEIVPYNLNGVYYIKVFIDKNVEKYPFTYIEYAFENDGIDGFTFKYTYDETKQLSPAVKESIVKAYSLPENAHKMLAITNKI